MTDEKIRIVVDVDGNDAKQVFASVGRVGMNAADSIRKAFRDSLRNMSGPQTNLATEARVAMNSFKLMEKDKATAARETARIQADAARAAAASQKAADADSKASAKELQNSKHAMYKLAQMDARAAAQAEAAAARQAASAQIAAARAAAAAEKSSIRGSLVNFQDLQRRKAAMAKQEAAAEAAINKQKLAQERAANKAERDLRRDSRGGMGLLTGAIGFLGVREAASEFIELSDSMQNARNRLQIVTNGSAETEVAMGKLKDMALDTRTAFDTTIRTYTRMAQSTKALGVSQQSNYDMTKVLTQAIAVGGATTEEAHATLIQFSQAMGSNRLSADEFRSVAEQMPIILDMLAKSTGRAKVELKEMGQKGLLTARVMTIALLEAVEDMDAKFKKTMPTISQSWQNVKTQAEFALDAFNRSQGAAQSLVSALQYMASHMDIVGTAIQHVGLLIGTYMVVEVGKLTISLALLAMNNPFTAMAIGATQLLLLVSENRESVRDWIRDIGVTLAGGDPARSRANQTVQLDDNGNVISSRLKDGTDLKAAGDKDQQLIHQEYAREQRLKEIKRLRAMTDTIKDKKGRHKANFDELVQPLEDDVAAQQLSKSGRATFDAISNIEKQMNSGVARKNWVMLTEAQREYVSNLVAAKKATSDLESTNKALFDAWMKRQEEYKKGVKYGSDEARRLKHEEGERMRHLKSGDVESLNSPDEVDMNRATLRRGVVSGKITGAEARRANNKLEIQDARTSDTRKEFLTEFTKDGKFNQEINAIWGPNGSLNQGLSNAIAQSIVFHKSFKQGLRDLGRTIEAEIINTLVQGLIRMAILTAMGGGSGTAAANINIPPAGHGRASGGYTGDMGRTQIVGYHHGQEFVVNAQGTAQNREVLETINRGGRVGRSGGGVNITIHNNGTNADFEVNQLGPNDVELIATRVVNQRAPGVVAGTMRDPNSRMSKAVGGNTTARRARS